MVHKSKMFIAILTYSIFSSIIFVNSISVMSEGDKDICFKKYFDTEDEMNFSYIVSGEDELSIDVIIKDSSGNIIYSKVQRDHDTDKRKIQNGDYELCFKPISRSSNDISFNWYGLSERGHMFNIAKGEELNQMQTDVLSLRGLFEQIEINTKYIIDRQQKHAESKLLKE